MKNDLFASRTDVTLSGIRLATVGEWIHNRRRGIGLMSRFLLAIVLAILISALFWLAIVLAVDGAHFRTYPEPDCLVCTRFYLA